MHGNFFIENLLTCDMQQAIIEINQGGNYMTKKYWKCIVVWIGVMCGISSIILIEFLPHIVSAIIGLIGISILVATVIYLLNKM